MREVAETRHTAEKLLKGHNSGKNQLIMTSIKYAHLQVMATISRKFHKNPLKTVGGVAETRTFNNFSAVSLPMNFFMNN